MSVLRSHYNKTHSGLGRVCATGMYRSIEHVKFPKFQTAIFVEWDNIDRNGVLTTIAKHHGRYLKSDVSRWRGVNISTAEWIFVNYAVDIYNFALNLFRKLLKKKVCPILREKTVSFRW